MANTSVLRGKRALVTGASSGLGSDFARQLAAMGTHLVLVARREDLLRQLAAELSAAYKVEVDIITADLSQRSAPQEIYDRLKAENKPVDVLINNAGFGLYGEFTKIELDRELNMLDLDIQTVVALTKLFLKDMVDRNFGYVLQVASIGAYQSSPLYATYSAAKSFVLHFSEAVHYELRRTNVNVCTLSPGITRTAFLEVSGQKPSLYQRIMMMESETVVRIGLNAMLNGRMSIVPGVMNALTIQLNRVMPRGMTTVVAELTMRLGSGHRD